MKQVNAARVKKNVKVRMTKCPRLKQLEINVHWSQNINSRQGPPPPKLYDGPDSINSLWDGNIMLWECFTTKETG